MLNASMSSARFHSTAPPLTRLIVEFNKLPGIGPKSAQRLAYYMTRLPAEEAQAFAQAIMGVKELIIFCRQCQNLTDVDPCQICNDHRRQRRQICVVEAPLDVEALERTRRRPPRRNME